MFRRYIRKTYHGPTNYQNQSLPGRSSNDTAWKVGVVVLGVVIAGMIGYYCFEKSNNNRFDPPDFQQPLDPEDL